MSERERAMTIPDANETLRIEPINGGWLIWTGVDVGLQATPPIPVTDAGDLSRIVAMWACPTAAMKEKGQ